LQTRFFKCQKKRVRDPAGLQHPTATCKQHVASGKRGLGFLVLVSNSIKQIYTTHLTPISVSHRAKAAVCEDVRSGDEAGVVREEEEGDLKSDREGAARTANRCYTALSAGPAGWGLALAMSSGCPSRPCASAMSCEAGTSGARVRMARLARGEASLSLSGWGRALLLLLRTHSSLRGSHRTVP